LASNINLSSNQLLLEQMIELEKKLGIQNPDWLMSAREKLSLIGLLELLRPQRTLEFGYHRGGATKWLAKYSDSVITVDVNEFVRSAEKQFSNVTSWNCSTGEAINRIKAENHKFDLAIIDADHSRKAVSRDLFGIIKQVDVILMHDSSNPSCRKGMTDVLRNQDSHAYNLDFISSSIKHDGLWGGLGVAIRSSNPFPMKEFDREISPYCYLWIHDSISFGRKTCALGNRLGNVLENIISKAKVRLGGLVKK
jgi:hypothetical protein